MSTENIPLLSESFYERDFQTFESKNKFRKLKSVGVWTIQKFLFPSASESKKDWTLNSETNKISRRCDYDNPTFLSQRPGAQIRELSWLTIPVRQTMENHILPAFSIQSNPQVTENIKLIVHSQCDGQAQVSGTLIKPLEARGLAKPSVAKFDDISIRRAGQYVLEVKCLRNPNISVIAENPLTIVPLSCPNYRLHLDYAPTSDFDHLKFTGVL